MSDKKVIGTVMTTFTGWFPNDRINLLLNMHYINSESCNELDKDGNVVGKKHPNMDKLVEAQYKSHASAGRTIEIEADVFDDGEIGNFRIVEEE